MSSVPRILICGFDLLPAPTGFSRRITEYLRGLSGSYSVVVLTTKIPELTHIERYLNARLLRVPVGAGELQARILAFDRAVRRQLESEEYSLVHFTDPFGGYALCELREKYGYRTVYEAQTLFSEDLPFTQPQTEGDRRFLSKIRRQELFCLMNADQVICGSETTRSFLHGLGVHEDLVSVVRAPVDLEPYRPELVGSPDGVPARFLYVGSQVGWQGLSLLLRALQLASREIELRLQIVGPRHPRWHPHLEALSRELGIFGLVEMAAPVGHDELFKVLAGSDVGLLPLERNDRNTRQGGPLAKLTEYLAAGRPVIAADLPVTRELAPAESTLFYAADDPAALASRLVELARDPARRTEMGARGRTFARDHLASGRAHAKLRLVYEKLLGAPLGDGRTPPGPLEGSVTGTPTSRMIEEEGEIPKTDPEIHFPFEGPAHVPDRPPTPPSPPRALDAWAAQLMEGYCPPA